MPKDPKKIMFMMTILRKVIEQATNTVREVVEAKGEYIIAVAVLLKAAWQILNYRQWKKSLK